MAVTYSIPRPNSAPLTDRGLLTTEWYNYLRNLSTQGANETLQAEIAAIAARVAALEGQGAADAVIVGLGSLLVTGSLSDGQVFVQLESDEDAPEPDHYYGTDSAGAKGFHPLPTGGGCVPYFIPDGTTYTVPEYTQALFAMPIDAEGLLAVDGYLIGVD